MGPKKIVISRPKILCSLIRHTSDIKYYEYNIIRLKIYNFRTQKYNGHVTTRRTTINNK